MLREHPKHHHNVDRLAAGGALLLAHRRQIRGVVESTAGPYGDKGIAGRSLVEIDGLELARIWTATGDRGICPLE
jgi:hypothetical protein